MRRLHGRKDADHEFFVMTLVSQIMTHKKQRQLIEMQADADKLFLKCKNSGQPFFKWHDWIGNHIETSLTQLAEFKKNRLAKIFSRGQTKLLQNVEEKKLKGSVLLTNDAANNKK